MNISLNICAASQAIPLHHSAAYIGGDTLEKTPAYIIGERILGPMIRSVSNYACKWMQFKDKIKKMVWVTDTHVDKLPIDKTKKLVESIKATKADLALITGDIGENQATIDFIKSIGEEIEMPLYYVLGNHDFYTTSIETLTSELKKLKTGACYLPAINGIELSEKEMLIGIDNWNDLEYRSEETAPFSSPDYEAILNFKGLSIDKVKEKIAELTKQNLIELEEKLTYAFEVREMDIVYIAMHVPPYSPHYYYKGTDLESPWSFYWTNKEIGEFLNDFMKKWPKKKLKILSGHTHIPALYKPMPNIESYIGSASSKTPQLIFFNFE